MTIREAIKRIFQLVTGLFVVGLTSVAIGAPKPETNVFSAPHDASTYGHHIDWLIDITNLFCAILFGIMCVWMLIAIVKHNKNHSAEYDHGSAKKQVKHALLISSVIFFIVDGNLWINSTADVTGMMGRPGFWNFEKVSANPDTLRIEINARQWIWQARYAGPDGKFNTKDDALADNDIRVPVDTPVLLQLASPDVIHTFTLTNFRIRQDAMPGMINMMWFQAKETGEFDIACVQNCGANHYQMKGLLTVLSKKDYEAWLALKSRDGAAIWDDKDTEAHWGWEWKKI